MSGPRTGLRLRRVLGTVMALAAVTALLAGCGVREIGGEATPLGGLDTGSVAGLPAANGPSGLKPGVPDAGLPVNNGDRGEMDRIALNAVADVQTYWSEQFGADFKGAPFTPVSRLNSYDSDGANQHICESDTKGVVNAFYCPLDDSISWDRGELLPMLYKQYGPMSVVTVLAHELGHMVQYKLARSAANAGVPPDAVVNQNTPTVVKEQQADCYAGNFFRAVADGKSQHFQISTGDGLDKIMATMFSIRDQVGSSYTGRQAHGSAFDRVYAFQTGFAKDPMACASIGVKDVQQRIQEFPFKDKQIAQTGGELPINDKDLQLVEDDLQNTFSKAVGNHPEYQSGPGSCGSAQSTVPVAYCPDTNVISIDLSRLKAIGTPPSKHGDGKGIGDFAAYGELASRFVLAAEKEAGYSLDDPKAGLRTACLVGAWGATKLERPFGQSAPTGHLRLAPGDLDKAVAELLRPDGLIAADVNGKVIPSGFARVEAFRIGFMQGTTPCTAKFS